MSAWTSAAPPLAGFANQLRREAATWWGTRRWWWQSAAWTLGLGGILAAMLWVVPAIADVAARMGPTATGHPGLGAPPSGSVSPACVGCTLSVHTASDIATASRVGAVSP